MISMLKYIVILFLLTSVSLADSSLQTYPDSAIKGPQNFAVYDISLTANATGFIDLATQAIYGKLYAVSWINTTDSTINGTIYLNTTDPYVVSLENYDLSGGNATEYPRTSTLMYPLSGPATLDCDDCDANQTVGVRLYVEL